MNHLQEPKSKKHKKNHHRQEKEGGLEEKLIRSTMRSEAGVEVVSMAAAGGATFEDDGLLLADGDIDSPGAAAFSLPPLSMEVTGNSTSSELCGKHQF